ncbi:MAG TPA: VanW family protein [Anaerolineae bacterium]
MGRNVGYFLVAPITALVIFTLIVAFAVTSYQSRHSGRVYTGVSVMGVDLSGMSLDEAEAALSNAFPYTQEAPIILADPGSDKEWVKTPAELGMVVDVEATAQAALEVGRAGGPFAQMRDLFASWFYGYTLAPVLVLDEGKLEQALSEVAVEVNQPPINATLAYSGSAVDYTPAQAGRILDIANVQSRAVEAISNLQPARIELLIHEVPPAIYDSGEVASHIQQTISGPITFYLPEPLDDLDLPDVVLPEEEFAGWLRFDVVQDENNVMEHQVFVDENAVRHWLSQFAEQIYRDPVNARFYFDDNTRELVLVAPHVNGRELDVDATVERFMAQVNTANRSVPFIVKEIVPTVHAGATATELGITELITQTTTWFYGSSDERKHNIARAAANFYGIVIAPGEQFSFNKYLGTVSEADGYEEGLIIVGGRTIKGIGGGVCQVSTTLYQTAFLAGFPIDERWEHGYMLGYYNDGEGPGMDATVFSPIVDLKFTNNTPHHLLIENYYNEEFEALTFKFYSTSLGRRVVKEVLPWENIVPAPAAPEEDEWVYDEDLPPGTVQQIDWATDGADVTVIRTVYNAEGQPLYGEQEIFRSHYIPYPNVYHYGPGVEPYDYSLVPEDGD